MTCSEQDHVIVVYKVDRLTAAWPILQDRRSFDAKEFPRLVTQQFNTTSSMGRLTLNILLSFAQFEREVTGRGFGQDRSLEEERQCGWRIGPLPSELHEPFPSSMIFA